MTNTMILVGDVHLSDVPPTTRTSSYLDDVFKKLHQTIGVAISHSAESIVLVGDVFHSKVPVRTSHQTVARFLEWCGSARNLGKEVVILPGNHDYRSRSVELLPEHPLGVVFASGLATELGSIPMEVSGAMVSGVREEEPLEAFTIPGADVIVAHSALFPEADLPEQWEAFSHEQVREVLASETRLVYYGHIHDYHGIHKVGGVTFANLGALSRGSLFEATVDRKIRVGVVSWVPGRVETDGIRFRIQEAPIQYRPVEEVFRVEEVLGERAAAEEMASFAQALAVESVEMFSPEALQDRIANRGDVDLPVRERAVDLLHRSA